MVLFLLLAAAPLEFPLDSSKLTATAPLAKLEDVQALKLDTVPGKEGATLRDLNVPLEEGSTLRLLGDVKRGAFSLHVVRLDEEAGMMSVSFTFVLVKNAKGAWVDGAVLGSTASSEAGGVEETGTLALDGTITRRKVLRVPMHEEGLPSELVITAEAKGRLGADGKFTLTERFVTPDGAFIDAKSKEELRVFVEKIFYRANDTKPFQALLREKDDVRFKPGAKPYKLKWSADRSAIDCTNPDGTVQRFAREW